MSFSKLKKLHVIIIGSVLCILAGVAIYFLLVKPQQAQYKVMEARYQAAIPQGTQQAVDQATRSFNDTVHQLDLTQQMLDAQMKRRMPDLSFERRDVGMLALWNEQIKTLGPLLQSFLHDNSVDVVSSGFTIPPPPINPNSDVFDKDMLEFDLGSVSVSGDFKSVMNNMRRWNNCRRLVMVSAPTLAGVSPSLVATYNLKCYIFPVAKGGPKIPMAGEATQTAAAQ